MSASFPSQVDRRAAPSLARALSLPPAIPGLAINHTPPRREVVSQSPLSFHLANFKGVRSSDATWKVAIDPLVESGKEGLYYRVFANAKGRLRNALGKDAYDEIDKLTIKERCILCRLITQATKIPGQDKHEEVDATELAQTEARDALFALAAGSGAIQALAKKTLAKIAVLSSPQNLSDENLERLTTLADFGNKNAVAILMAGGEIRNQKVLDWLETALQFEETPSPSARETIKGLARANNAWAQQALLENWESEPPHELDLVKELVKEGNQWAKEQLQLRALNQDNLVSEEVQRAAEDALLDLINANDPEGVKLMVHLLTTKGAAASEYFFDEFNSLLGAGKAGALHVLKNLALQGDPIAINEIIRLAESNPTKFGNLAAFLFMLQHRYPDHPAAKRLGARLGGRELPNLAETMAAMARLYAQFESRDTETVRAIKLSLGTRAEVEQCLATHRQQAEAAAREGDPRA